MDRKFQGKDRLSDDDISSNIQSMILEGKRCASKMSNEYGRVGEWVRGKGMTIL